MLRNVLNSAVWVWYVPPARSRLTALVRRSRSAARGAGGRRAVTCGGGLFVSVGASDTGVFQVRIRLRRRNTVLICYIDLGLERCVKRRISRSDFISRYRVWKRRRPSENRVQSLSKITSFLCGFSCPSLTFGDENKNEIYSSQRSDDTAGQVLISTCVYHWNCKFELPRRALFALCYFVKMVHILVFRFYAK